MATITTFFEHEAQYVMALFLTKPELYKEFATCKDKERQDYFFYRFRIFAENYYHFSPEESVYFASTRKEAMGEANICGGGGKRSGSSSRYLKDRYRLAEQERENRVDSFAKKYGVSFNTEKDPRLFLGVSEIWNKLHSAIEIVAASKWSDAVEKSYSDASFETPIPEKVEKILVPLKIRNKTMQKIRNRRNVGNVCAEREIDKDMEENVTNTYNVNEKMHNIMVAIPAEIYDEDW